MSEPDLPKALSEEERAMLRYLSIGARALALIDALTEHLAEAVARMTVAESRVQELQRACDDYFELTDDLDPPDMLVHWRADRQKLAAANALLSDALDAINQDAWSVLADGIRAHIKGIRAFTSELDDNLKAKHDIVDVKELDEVDFISAFAGALHD